MNFICYMANFIFFIIFADVLQIQYNRHIMFYRHLILRNKICGVTCFNQYNKHTNETQVYLFINGNTEIGIQLLLIINLLMFIYMFYCIKQQYKQLIIHFHSCSCFFFSFPFLKALFLFHISYTHTHICARFPTYYSMNNTLHSLQSLTCNIIITSYSK